ncbi:MAG: purine-nucleoside phosphorylase [Bacteroidota bacterium]
MTHNPLGADVQDAQQALSAYNFQPPEIALVLGSGLGGLADAIEDAVIIPTGEIPGYPVSTAPGHKGRLVIGKLEGRQVVAIQGRVHVYEGYPARASAFPIRLVHALGASKLLLTNAAGGINKDMGPGTLMFIRDHINFAFEHPLAGPNVDGGQRFVDLCNAYDPDWLERAEAAALAAGIAAQKGVYLWTKGPSYETKAEIHAYRQLGADAVGMSTVPETLQANYLGMKVLGISTITNPAAGMSPEPLRHEDVLAVGQQIRATLEKLVRVILKQT